MQIEVGSELSIIDEISRTIKTGMQKTRVGTVTYIGKKFIVVRFKHYTESFTPAELKRRVL